jgi:GAF domain-containing protein
MDPDSTSHGSAARFQLPVGLDLTAHSTETVLSAVADLAVRGTAGAVAASVTILHGDAPSTTVSTGPVATALDESQYAQGYGPCLDAVLSGDVIDILDTRAETRWPKFTPLAVEAGVLSMLSLPIPVDQPMGAGLNVYAAAEAAFTPGDRDGLTSLVGFAAAAITNVRVYEASKTLVEQMQTAMQSRAVIDQARGILMAQHRCDAEEAFAILRRTSQQGNRKIRDLAQAIVDSVTKG